MNKVELLAPAGDLEKLKWAFHYGADAVYIGGRDYSLRANAKNFSLEDIKSAVNYAHKLNKKVYVTMNIIYHNEDYKDIEKYIKELDSIGVDAVIVSDIGCINLIKKIAPNLEIHLSTQASCLNKMSAKFYKNLGVKRIVLGREANKDDIKDIIKYNNIDVECFVHGAMCSSLSGRCVLSNYMTNRDSNRGGCAQICRWDFDLYGKEKIDSTTKFTMCSKDLQMIKYIKDMIDIGVKSFKVEGRMRSIYYISTVLYVYRRVIDEYLSKGNDFKLDPNYIKILSKVANRDSVPQFFDKHPGVDEQYYLGRQENSNQDFLGIVLDYKDDMITMEVRNYFKLGDEVEVFGPNTPTFKLKIERLIDEDGINIDVARHPKQILKIPCKTEVKKYDIIRIKYIF